MALEPVGDYDMLAPPPAFRIETPRPVTRLHCVMTVVANFENGVAAQKSLGGGIRAFLRQIQLLRGGQSIQTWGGDAYVAPAGWVMTNLIQAWLLAKEQIDDVPSTPNGVTTLKLAFTIPISLPSERYSLEGVNLSALRIKPQPDKAADLWTVKFFKGEIGDLVDTPGTSSIISSVVEVVAETDETLDMAYPADALILYAGNHAIDLGGSAQTRAPFDLPKDGLLLAQGQLTYNNLILTNDLITKIEYVYNTREVLSEMSYKMQQFLASLGADAPANYPVGLNWINWDTTYDLANAINAPAATQWVTKLDYIQPTVRGDQNEQMLYMLPATVAFERKARS